MAASKTKSERPEGRPTDYEPGFATTAGLMCLNGATDAELAEEFDVDVRTIYRWKHKHPEFCQALSIGKNEVDVRVERALYQKAVAGDTTAMIFWLKNRRRDQWRDRVDVNHSGNLSALTDEQLNEKLAELEAKAKGQTK